MFPSYVRTGLSLRTQIVAALLALVSLPTAILGAGAILAYGGELNSWRETLLRQEAVGLQAHLDSTLRRTQSALNEWLVTKTADLLRDGDIPSIVGATSRHLRADATLTVLMLLTPAGEVLIVDNLDETGLRRNLTHMLGRNAYDEGWMPRTWLDATPAEMKPMFQRVTAFRDGFPEMDWWLLLPTPLVGVAGDPEAVWIAATPIVRLSGSLLPVSSALVNQPYQLLAWTDGGRVVVASDALMLGQPVPFLEPESITAGIPTELDTVDGQRARVYAPSNESYGELARVGLHVAAVLPVPPLGSGTRALLIVAGLLLLIGVGIAFALSYLLFERRLFTPLSALSHRTRTMLPDALAPSAWPSDGSSNSTRARDAIDTLEQDLQTLCNALAEQLASTTTRIDAAVSEISQSTNQQNLGSAEQSEAVKALGSTMDALLEWGQQIRKIARFVLENAERTQQNNKLVAERIHTLSARSQRITEILEGIKEIATKSEMLALNAALEGTKAGPAGRGFSLVASQMQGLAENVMGAVRDIRTLTSEVREATHASILATEEGTKLAEDTTESARQISAFIEHQQEGTERVAKALANLTFIAEQNVVSSKSALQATDQLVHQGHILEEVAVRLLPGGPPAPDEDPPRGRRRP